MLSYLFWRRVLFKEVGLQNSFYEAACFFQEKTLPESNGFEDYSIFSIFKLSTFSTPIPPLSPS
ncbi:hypothetical protein Enr17x_61210 [Gimesia fumaroli]|uniref:Uncharacterized protein n=1 Tax=Gimesia fumaroli TaxID=2527976 RepID=A0A518ILR8_9PLAN|nr:hypothetical protein Enr17x_61210 [Gimesia fumaroli]